MAPPKSSTPNVTDENTECCTIRNTKGMQATVTTYGATLIELRVPDGKGILRNVVLVFPILQQYVAALGYFGATIGRYANRICDGRFILDGKEYQVTKNENGNTLHGGCGFDKRMWKVEHYDNTNDASVALSYLSEDMEEGFPGRLNVQVVYRLTDQNALEIEFRATTDKPTPINLTHHSYFNLNGEPGIVLNHDLWIDADNIVDVDNNLRPTGKLKPVEGTPFDFRTKAVIGDKIKSVPNGYDHNFCLNSPSMNRSSLTLHSPVTGIALDLFTNQPGVQLYTCNGTKPEETCGAFDKYYGLTLETQTYPNGINQQGFPNSILRPGETYIHDVRYQFSVRD